MENSERGGLVRWAEEGWGKDWQALKKKEDTIHHTYGEVH